LDLDGFGIDLLNPLSATHDWIFSKTSDNRIKELDWEELLMEIQCY